MSSSNQQGNAPGASHHINFSPTPTTGQRQGPLGSSQAAPCVDRTDFPTVKELASLEAKLTPFLAKLKDLTSVVQRIHNDLGNVTSLFNRDEDKIPDKLAMELDAIPEHEDKLLEALGAMMSAAEDKAMLKELHKVAKRIRGTGFL